MSDWRLQRSHRDDPRSSISSGMRGEVGSGDAILTEDGAVVAVSEGMMIESTRLKPLLGGRRNGGGVSHVALCTQGGETGFAPQPHASGSNNRTHTHIHITLTRWEGRQACEGAGRGHSREGAFLHIRRSSSGPTPHTAAVIYTSGWSLHLPARYCGEASLGHKRVQV